MKQDVDARFKSSQTKWFRSRTYHEHAIIRRETRAHVNLEDARILDFGCGSLPIASASIALRYPMSEVVATDILPISLDVTAEHMRREAGYELPNNFFATSTEPSSLPESLGQFDLIYAWSVFEHIIPTTEIPVCFSAIRERLKPGGVFFFQIGGLYFSHDGSHLRSLNEPWVHLLYPLNILHQMVMAGPRVNSSKDAEWQQFFELNRLTCDDFMDMAEASGFHIVKQDRIEVGNPPENLTRIYGREVLTTNEIRAILKVSI